MKKIFLSFCFFACCFTSTFAQDLNKLLKEVASARPKSQIEIMILGSTHFGQESYYKDFPKADLFDSGRQEEIMAINNMLQRYGPDMIMIENTPEEQKSVDSLYHLYKTGSVSLKEIPYGRAERFQFGYRLAKSLNHERIYGVDYYESVSNRILTKGQNIDIFEQGLNQFSHVGRQADKALREEGLPLRSYLLFLNNPEILNLAYEVLFLNPAKVRNGELSNPPVQYVDTAFVNPQYVGAEFISIFYERELKIYSNITSTQLKHQGRKLLVVMGHRHAAALTKIFAQDPAYKVVNPARFLMK